MNKRRPSISLAILDVLVGTWCFLNLVIVPYSLVNYPYGHSLIWLLILALFDTRLLLLALAVLAPAGLFNHEGEVLYSVFEVIASLIAISNGASVLGPLLWRRASKAGGGLGDNALHKTTEEKKSNSALFTWGWPAFVSFSLAAYLLATFAAAIAPAPNIFYDEIYWNQAPGQPYFNHMSLIAISGHGASFAPWRELLFLYFAVSIMRFVYRRFDTDQIRRFLFIGGAMAFFCALLGIAEYYKMLDLRGYRPGREPLDYIFETRRLMSLGQHSAWFAQYIVLSWPFILILYPRLTGRWRKMLIVGIVIMAIAAFLTLQRAFWLIMASLILGLIVMQWFRGHAEFGKTVRRNWRFFVGGALCLLLFLAVTNYLYDNDLMRRMVTLFRYRDRLNYFYSGFFLLTESPAGIGLGQHHWIYSVTFLPFADFYQTDHGTAHNYWLHLLVERGIMAPIAMTILPIGMARLLWKRRIRMAQEDRLTALALGVSLTGIFLYGIFQYIEYLRIIQLLIFIELGMLLKLCVLYENGDGEKAEAPLTGTTAAVRLALLVGIGAVACVSALGQLRFHRTVEEYHIGGMNTESGELWTGKKWRVALPCSAEKLEGIIYSLEIDNKARVSLDEPNAREREIVLPANQAVWFQEILTPYDAPVWRKFRWMTFEAERTKSEALRDPDAIDSRQYGLYLTEFTTEERGLDVLRKRDYQAWLAKQKAAERTDEDAPPRPEFRGTSKPHSLDK